MDTFRGARRKGYRRLPCAVTGTPTEVVQTPQMVGTHPSGGVVILYHSQGMCTTILRFSEEWFGLVLFIVDPCLEPLSEQHLISSFAVSVW